MVKSYIWTAEKISGLNFSGVGLKTTMITSAWCSTPSTTRATGGRTLCKKKTTTTTSKQTKQNKKQSKNGNIVKSGKSGRLGDLYSVKMMKNRRFWDCNSNFQKHTKHKSDHRRKQICLNWRNVFFKYCVRKGSFLWKESEIAIFYFFEAVVLFGGKKIAPSQKWVPTIHHSHKKSKVSALPLEVDHFHS